MKYNISKTRLTIFLLLLFIFFTLIFFNSFSHVKFAISDKLYSNEKVLDNIVIIAIDDKSIQEIGRWPWNRTVYATLLQKINNAKVIGIDLSYFEESSDDKILEEQLSNMDNIVLSAEFNNGILYKSVFNTDYGYVNVITDTDGVVRSFDSGMTNEAVPFSLEIYNKAFPKKEILPQKYLINFARPNSFKTYSFSNVLSNNFNFSQKIILIGATAPNLHDFHYVPSSNGVLMAGVEVHANIIQNLILNSFLETQGQFSIYFLISIFGLIGLFFISRMNVFYSILVVVLFILIYAFISILIFEKFNIIIDIFFVPLSLIVFSGVGQAVNYLEEKKEKAYLTDAFGRYISRDLLKEIVEHKTELKLGGGKREITIFFSDIRSFTSISEKLSPEELVELLNDYLTSMTKIILKYKGTVDKFIGDAVMAFWNAPTILKDHAYMACECTIEQIKELRKLREKWIKDGFPKIEIGCGIHTGDAIIGNMGSEDRFDYTAMGDTINLGSRLEGLTKQYGVDVIISENTFKKLKNRLKCRKLDAVKVKGKNIPIIIYELCIESNDKFIEKYESALKLYFKKEFEKALKDFEKALNLKSEDKSTLLFIERCREYIKNKPDKDWDGSFEMKTK